MSPPDFQSNSTLKIVAVVAVATLVFGGVSLAAGAIGGHIGALSTQEQPRESQVRLQPANTTAATEGMATYDIVAEGVESGVGAYNVSVATEDTTATEIADIELYGTQSPEATAIAFAEDNSSVTATAELADAKETGDVRIAAITVRGDEVDARNLALTVNALETASGQPDAVTEPGDLPAPREDDDTGEYQRSGGDSTEITSCTDITEPGTYTLPTDIQNTSDETCIEIEANDVVLDGGGHTITGPGDSGVGIGLGQATTVRNTQVENWDVGFEDGGDNVRFANVTVADNRVGMRLLFVHGIDADNLTLVDNEAEGMYLSRESSDGVFRDLTVRRNGVGVWFDEGAGNHTITGSTISNNDGSGVIFKNAGSTTIRDTSIAANGGHGINLGEDANGEEQLENVTFENNDGLAIDRSRETLFGNVTADRVYLGPTASVQFSKEFVSLDRDTIDTLPSNPAGDPVTTQGVNVTHIDDAVTVSFTDADFGDSDGELWRYDGTDWTQVEDVTVDGNTITGTVTADGIVVPVAADTTAAGGSGGDGSPEESILEIVAQEEGGMHYRFVVDGSVEKTELTDKIGSGDNDKITELGDGTVVVHGETGNPGYGDAYRIDGDIQSYERTTGDIAVTLQLGGDPVTAGELSSDGAAESGETTGSSLFEIVGQEEGGMEYRLVVDGSVEKTELTERIGSGDNDEITRQNDGTIVVDGETGNPGYGDAYRIDGEIQDYERTSGDIDVNLRLNGLAVTTDQLSDDTGNSPGDTGPGSADDSENDTGGDSDPGPSTFEIVAQEEGGMHYRFVVDGSVEKTELTDKIGSGDNDKITELGDGTVVVSGETGNPGYGDAYRIDGEIENYERTAGDIDVNLRLGGDAVTADQFASSEPADSGDVTSAEPSLLEIVAQEEGGMEYRLVVDGSVEKTELTERIGSGDNDEVTRQNDGTVVVDGETGNPGYGDAYLIEGEIRNYERTGGDIAVSLRLNGFPVTGDQLSTGS